MLSDVFGVTEAILANDSGSWFTQNIRLLINVAVPNELGSIDAAFQASLFLRVTFLHVVWGHGREERVGLEVTNVANGCFRFLSFLKLWQKCGRLHSFKVPKRLRGT